MLSASRRAFQLNAAVRRICLASATRREICRPSISKTHVRNFETLKRRNYVTLSGGKYDALITKENENEGKDLINNEIKEDGNLNIEMSSKNVGTQKAEGIKGKFRNYSSSDYQNVASLRREFNAVMESQDASLTPYTAYQFIRNCGNKMTTEPPENRIALVLEIWGKLKEKNINLETTHYNALLSVYIQNRHHFSPLEFLADMQENKVQPDKSTYMLIVQAYCQEGDLTGALRVIDFMTKQEIPVSEPIYTSLITGYSKNNDMEGAHRILTTMRENGIIPQVDSYTALIAGYASHGDMESIDKVFEEMKENDIKTNALLYMNMLDSFCRSGHSSLLPEALSRIKHKAPIEMEMRYFLQRLLTRGDYESAAVLAKNNELWLPPDMLRQDEFTPLNLFVYRLMRIEKPLDELINAMKVLEAHGITNTPLEDVLDLCHGRKATGDAIKMLDILKEAGRPVKSHYVYPMLVQLSDKEDIDGIFDLLNYMDSNKIKIDPFALDSAAKGFKNQENGRMTELLEFAKSKGVKLSRRVASERFDSLLSENNLQSFIDMLPNIQIGLLGTKEGTDKLTEFLIRTFDAKETPKAIIALDEKNLYRLGWVLSKILEQCNIDDASRAKDAFKIFRALVKANSMKGLNTYCYTVLLNTFFKNSMRNEFFEVVNVMKEQGIEPNEAQYFIMLKMSSLIGNSAAAQFCFDKLKEKQSPTEAQYNALLIAYGKDDGKGKAADEPMTHYAKKVTSLFEEMKELGLRPSGLSVSEVLVAYTNAGKYEEAEEVKTNFGLGAEHRKYAVYNEYMRMFAKKGNVEEAEKLFQEIKDSSSDNLISLFTYNQLIGCHKQAGNIERINELIQELSDRGFTPNRITFTEVVKTYIRRGEPEKALQYLEQIEDTDRLPHSNFLTNLAMEFFEKTDVENCERAIAFIRKRNLDEWAEQRLKHLLLMIYLKDNNLSAATDIVNKVDFRLTQRLIMVSLGTTYKDIDFLLKVKNFLKDQNLNHFLMDLAILNCHIAGNDADAAIKLYEEKRDIDSAMTNYFLTKLANFLTSSGRKVPFDTTLLKKDKYRKTNQEELTIGDVKIADGAEELETNEPKAIDDQESNRSEKE